MKVEVLLFALALIGGLLALGVAFRLFMDRVAAKRTEKLRPAAQAMGFTFEENVPLSEIGDFPLFREGDDPKLTNVARGEIGGRRAIMCDFTYTIDTGKGGDHPIVQTIVAFTERGSLPDFDLFPENVFHKVLQVFGYKDIDFEESEEFSKKYLLRGPDVIAIRGVFTLSARVQLESQPGWSVQCRAGRLIVFRARDAATAEELPTLAANASRIADALWPR